MVRVKICGLTRLEDIDAVNAAMPDYAGFVFAENSRRNVTPELAAALSNALDPSIVPVGVFVNQPFEFIADLFNRSVIRIAQLHGGENDAFINRLKQARIPVIQAIRDGRGDVPSTVADFHLFDGAVGGSGKARNYTFPDFGKPVFIAGGIGLNNIEDALAQQPYAVDVSSGVETNGLKDAGKIAELVAYVTKGRDR